MRKVILAAAVGLPVATMLVRNAPAAAPMDDERRQPMVGFEGRRDASFVPATYDETARTVDAVLSAGTAVRRWSYIEQLDISDAAIDLTRAESGLVKLLDTHNQWEADAVLGSVSDVRIEDGQLVGKLHFGETDRAVRVAGMVQRGELKGISIGYRVTKWEVVVPSQDDKFETWRAAGWELLEVSLVSVPADPNAGVRSATSNQPGANGLSAAIEEEDEMKRNLPGGAAAPAAPATVVENRAEPAQAPSTVTRFTASTALAFVEQARAFGENVVTRANELIAQNENGEISIEGARSALMTSMADAQRAQTSGITGGGVAITVTQDERDKWRRGVEASLIVRAGVAPMVSAAAKARGETIDLDPGEFRGLRNVDIARMALDMHGIRSDRMYDRDRIVSDALTVRSGNTTSDFPLILENVMHKTLQAAYATTPDTWRRVCGIGSVSDFRPHPRYLRGTFGALDALTEDGEYKNKSIPDAAKESITAATKGNIIALSRQAIVNDDLGAFNFLAVELGRAGKLSIEKDFYALLALNSGMGPTMNDGNPLFHATHNNIAGTAAAPSVDAFDAIRVLMASQKDVSGNEILDITPSLWLGPLSLGGTARVINGSEYDPDAANKLQRKNKVYGLFADIVDTARLTGTPWYAFADANVAPAIEVVFLDGNQEPFLDQQDGWRTDGTEWKVRLDYGIGGVNYRSAAINAGA